MLLNHWRDFSKEYTLILLVMVITLLLGACKNQNPSKLANPAENEINNPPAEASVGQWKLPISIQEGEFYKVIGWTSDTEVVYITNQGQTSSIYRYNLLSGTSELIYRSESPVVTGLISPSKQFILIHSSPSTYEGVVTIIDLKGNQKLTQSIPSHELSFEWNPYNEAEILVSKFNEDWTYQTFLLNVKQGTMQELLLPQPFIKWQDEGRMVYLDWDKEEPGLFAPLIVRSLAEGSDKTLFEAVIHYNMFGNRLLTITVDGKDPSESTYSLYNEQFQEIFSFSIPQLSMYSDWLIPYYDYNGNKKQFMTLQPVTSGEADFYTDGFDMVSYDVKNGNHQLILSGIENEPILFSPSGDMLLYGHQLEKAIDLKEKKVYHLFGE
ncbi:hypothetical protein [Neobacillus muris]|uniref:YqgU-like beta propeller domain-containing protein n=1 Tax=Neobacillus muris TaxID=2941334 RepID=UPI00203BD6E5|nr:hypothetical protein [Neobacillus muris]